MWLDQMTAVDSRSLVDTTDIEQIRISKMSKHDLDELIAKQAAQGWVVRARTHESDGQHGVMLIRRKGLPISAELLEQANTREEGTCEIEEIEES